MNNRKKVLLLGNGINRIDNDYSWEQLMQDLLTEVGLAGSISIKDKPFPLLYEEILLRWLPVERERRRKAEEAQALDPTKAKPRRKTEEQSLKEIIGRLMERITSNGLHYKSLRIDVDEILTTNYDYNLQSKAPGGAKACKPIHPIKGAKYSFMRRYKAGDKILWHIHGERRAEGSIMLGYEQYAGYLQYVRNYMTDGYSYKESYKDREHDDSREVFLEPLHRRMTDEKPEILSWVDHFFFSDVFILGLNLDFTEMHLWWILDFRARMRFDKYVKIQNHITFIYPMHESEWIKPRIDLLCACGVRCIALPVENNNWKGMYSMALDYINSHPRNHP